MIPFKYKGYQIEIVGAVAPTTKVKAYNNTDDNIFYFKNFNKSDLLFHNFINKVKKCIDKRIQYLEQMNWIYLLSWELINPAWLSVKSRATT